VGSRASWVPRPVQVSEHPVSGDAQGRGPDLQTFIDTYATECCGLPDRHEYELYLAVENIDHTRTKTKSPQTNGICERF
jgi:hypothetical protein